MPALISEETRIEQINKIPNTRFLSWVGSYSGSKTRANLVCVKCGNEWTTQAFTAIKSKGCSICSGYAKKTKGEREGQISRISGISFVYWSKWDGSAKSIALVSCDECGLSWDATVNNLVNHGTGCPKCAPKLISKSKRLGEAEIKERIESIGGIMFLSFVGRYENAKSRVLLSCNSCHNEWITSSASILNGGTGCPQCAANRRADARRIDENVAISRINNIAGIKLLGWEHGHYTGVSGKAVVECDQGHVWSSTVTKLESGRWCPSCSASGYDPSKTGTLYALRSECGRYVKIGISNKPEIRIEMLKKRTPFSFCLIESITNRDGVVAKSLESYFHKKYGRSGLSGFDGATEWLPFSSDLLSDFIAKKRVYERF